MEMEEVGSAIYSLYLTHMIAVGSLNLDSPLFLVQLATLHRIIICISFWTIYAPEEPSSRLNWKMNLHLAV